MVKAVNKLVLEINNTENEYFEKAIFYVRPEMSCNSKLGDQAQLYLNGISLEKRVKRGQKSKFLFIIGALIGTAGAGIVSAVLFLTGVI